jgi:hypothetical protein
MNLFNRLRKEVGHGGSIPAGYQLAWYEPRRRMGIYFPAHCTGCCECCER